MHQELHSCAIILRLLACLNPARAWCAVCTVGKHASLTAAALVAPAGSTDSTIVPLEQTGWFLTGSGNRPLMPSAYATMYLAWGLYSFPNGYGAKQQDVYDNMKAGADYIVNSFDGTRLVVQVSRPAGG